jgi:hypothetical protein
MEKNLKIEFIDNPDFNQWLNENFPVDIEEYEFQSSEVLYNQKYDWYLDALSRYNKNPQLVLERVYKNFPNPIAHYLYEAEENYQNSHHRLDSLKSCWESIIFLIYGLIVGEARHRSFDLKNMGLNSWAKFHSDKVHDKLTIVENILDYVTKNGIPFECSVVIPIITLTDIRTLNQERNGFEHASAKTAKQQEVLYAELFPILSKILKELIGLENVKLFRYHNADIPLLPRCEIYNGNSINGKKEPIVLKKDNYFEIVDHFNAKSVFAQINGETFCVSPFIHFFQEDHETNALLCFYKKQKSGKYKFEVVSKSKDRDFEISDFEEIENKLKSLII